MQIPRSNERRTSRGFGVGSGNGQNGQGGHPSHGGLAGDFFAEATQAAVDVIARSGGGMLGQGLPGQTYPAGFRAPPPPPPPSRPDRPPAVPASASPALGNEAFWAMWADHQQQLLRQCMRMMAGNVADAEDALSTAMLRASDYFGAGGGASIDNHRAWLSRLVHNSCIDFYRARSRHRHWENEVEASGLTEIVPAVTPAPTPTPEEQAETGEQMRNLQKELDALPELLRTPLVMRFLDGLSYEEISERLGIPNCTARKRVQLARDRLRKAGCA